MADQTITEILAAWREIADVRDADRDGDFDPYSEAVAETLRSCAEEVERALPRADMTAVDRIANILAAPQWSGADFLEAIADTIGKVRPHPGGYPTRKAYAEVFAKATGRDVIEEDED